MKKNHNYIISPGWYKGKMVDVKISRKGDKVYLDAAIKITEGKKSGLIVRAR